MNDLLKTILLRLKSGQITKALALDAIRALRSGETPANQPELLFYRQIWEEAEVQAPQTPSKRPTFWIGEDAGAGDLEGDGPGVFHLRPGAEYQRVGEREFSLGKDFRAGLRKVLAAT
ncbi:MAG: hypothetical protein KGS61_21290, partial [Verrucomicrobia bacterium]|nr:hypothetical protein [Verrucomicrobiota bacterium]